MGMLELNKESIKRKELFMEMYETLKNDPDNESKPFLYGSNYSNPIYVCNYMMRLFPFSHISIELQGKSFDNPNRLFLSVENAFHNSISQTTDVKEIIPEFFYLPEMFFNSMWYCFIGVSAGVLMSTFTGYVIAKYEFKGRNVIYAIAIFCMTIPIIGTTSSMLKLVNSDYLPIYNTPFYVLLTSLGGFGFNFMVMHAFFKNVSWNYVEAVLIDGGGHYTAFFKVMLPQAHSSIVTLVILALIGSWNDYSTPMMFLPDYPTVASGIYTITKSNQRSDNMPKLFAGLVLSFIPALILFSIVSDRIMKNFSIGGLKG